MPRFRFGVFEFDASNAELRREGSPVRLQSQPAQALGILLSSAGQTVSRDELRRAIWDSETFVDFERGLNFCIAQIRSALHDSADSPRYIRTIPRKGYQFIPPVTVLPDASVAADADLAAPPPDRPPVSHTTDWPRRLLAPVPIVLLGALLALFIFEHRDKAPASKRVAVFRLDNATGDPQYQLLADHITDSLVAELTESG
ncbi:MAG: winged helix-turn-helix domain-containing protein, partial [Bryobacteraceae bacterium]|nr:winged helix-turn-helix domain-containing protein [Bryobacteraceae bacterium]